ncbi:MAG TPA: ATP-grasp domain-containing protein [Thermoanaerobaculia bacterium]|jgi:biotin carboxylase
MSRVLLLLPTRSYRIPDFLEAAGRVHADVVVATEEPSAVEGIAGGGLLTLDFTDPVESAKRVRAFAEERPIDAVIGVDEDTALTAAAIAAALGLPHNPIEGVAAARDKARMRELLDAAGVPSPPYRLFSLDDLPDRAAAEVPYPCVLKPTFLSGSRGVIRADDPDEFTVAWERIGRILAEPAVARRGGIQAQRILVEDFVPGAEVAVEGVLTRGRLRVLALFDKPDPLEGPYFEETIYVTPSRLPAFERREVERVAAAAVAALGLREGPVHAELRVDKGRPVVVEIAARSIGGLCSRALRFGARLSLEELVLRHALGRDLEPPDRETSAAGVMMIPIPKTGRLEWVRGVSRAKAVPGIDDVVITIPQGQRVVALPEGSRYLGFLFSRTTTPAAAEAALRDAHSKLEIHIT